MKISRVFIQNFLTIQRATLNLKDRGLNVIQGANADDGSASSNGAGKSSVVDALCWALYGVTARGVKGDAVVNLTAKKECNVRVHIEVGEQEYIVVRHRKDKEHKNALHLHVRKLGDIGAIPTDLSKGTDAETQKEVERVIGCSLDVFLAAVYAGQEIMPDLPKMTDRQLKSLIEEAAGMERIERAYEEARTRRSELQSRLANVSTKVDLVTNRIMADEGKLEAKKIEVDAFETARIAKVHEAEANVERIKDVLRGLLKKLQDQKPEVDAAHTRIAELNAQMDSFSEVETKARNAESAAVQAEASIGKALLVEARATVSTIAAQIENADAEMSKPCPECGKPHTEAEKAEYVAHRTKRLEDAKANLALVEDRVRKEVMHAKQLKEEAAALRAAVPDMSAVTSERKALEDIIKLYESGVSEVKLTKSRLDAAVNTVAMRKSEPNPAQAVVASLQESITTEAANLAALKTQQEELIGQLEVAEAVVQVFGPAGVRAQILDTVTPFLNERTADYLSALSDGAITACWTTLSRTAAGDLKEKFSIEVTNAKGGDSFLSLSGGEKRKVRLATALALQDLVASRATQPIDLFIGDEVDDALDPAGLERLMVIMERRARERGTVVLISHNDLADWCDEVTTVRKQGGYSTVEGSLCE